MAPLILVDSRIGSKELLYPIQRLGYIAKQESLEFGDCCFEGNGPTGSIMIGVERKRVSDMLNCIDDARYSAHQRPGMKALYTKDYLLLEGIVRPDSTNGYLLECKAQLTWAPFRHKAQWVRYSKLFRYLLSLELAGTSVIWTRDLDHSVFNITEICSYFQKKWEDHTAMLETQKLNIPDLRGKPSLVRRWAAEIEGVGVKHSIDAEKEFKTPLDLARSDETDWMRIKGVGAKLARKIIHQIHGSDY